MVHPKASSWVEGGTDQMSMSALSHLPVLSSAGEMDNVYELESSGTCAVALYDYQGGGSAIGLQHWELAGVESDREGVASSVVKRF